MMKIPDLEAFTGTRHVLPAIGTWRRTVHVFDERSAQAIRAAMAAGRPLLVRGEPGTGKSQLARAAAKVLGRKFLSYVVDAHTEIRDLWYRFDAVSRLGNAQVLSLPGNTMEEVSEKLDPQRYLSPGILWWAFDWKTAEEHKCDHPQFIPDNDDPGDAAKGVVLLLDEIDKADADLPNSLLETLDNGKFTVPWLGQSVGASGESQKTRPLVVITTNEDRQLPGAFVRRCMVLELALPDDEENLVRYLKGLAVYHFPKDLPPGDIPKDDQPLRNDVQGGPQQSRFDDQVLEEAARQLYKDRQAAETLGLTMPGQAEYLDILRVLDELASTETERQLELLHEIKDFALKKHRNMQKTDAGEESAKSE